MNRDPHKRYPQGLPELELKVTPYHDVIACLELDTWEPRKISRLK
jgi:hypothetical protein